MLTLAFFPNDYSSFFEKIFLSSCWTTDTLNMVDILGFSFLRDLHNDKPLVVNNYTENIKLIWMELDDATWCIFPEIDEKMLTLL